jgi:imidazolonepropionase-like amidohydrolase
MTDPNAFGAPMELAALAASLAEAHRLATLAALQAATSDAARARHAAKKWGRR